STGCHEPTRRRPPVRPTGINRVLLRSPRSQPNGTDCWAGSLALSTWTRITADWSCVEWPPSHPPVGQDPTGDRRAPGRRRRCRGPAPPLRHPWTSALGHHRPRRAGLRLTATWFWDGEERAGRGP